MPEVTNEQSVATARDDLDALKQRYMDHLLPLALRVQAGGSPTLQELMVCHQLATRYFNFAEDFVGNSDLLGAHKNGMWVTGFAENCAAILRAAIEHRRFVGSHAAIFGGHLPSVDENAFANMQRMVKKYLSREESAALRAEFEAHKLPIVGFQMPGKRNVDIPASIWLSVGLGLLATVASVVLAVQIPDPSAWQQFVFRALMAIGIAAMAAVIPGFVNARIGANKYFQIVAGGAIALFVILWFFNPPTVGKDANDQQPASQAAAGLIHAVAGRWLWMVLIRSP